MNVFKYDNELSINGYSKNDLFWVAATIPHECLNLKQRDSSDPNHQLCYLAEECENMEL